MGSPQLGNPRLLRRTLSQKAHCRLLSEAIQGLRPVKALSFVTRGCHSTFPHNDECFQNEHGERILAFHSSAVTLASLSISEGNTVFYLNSDYSPILFLFLCFDL